jgi:hypothetical protein
MTENADALRCEVCGEQLSAHAALLILADVFHRLVRDPDSWVELRHANGMVRIDGIVKVTEREREAIEAVRRS